MTESKPCIYNNHQMTISDDVMKKALEQLSQDEDLIKIINLIGPCRLKIIGSNECPSIQLDKLFYHLVKAVVGQQLHTKVALKIQDRLEKKLSEITPQKVLSTDQNDLKKIGLSFTKIKTLLGISKAFIDDPFFNQKTIQGSVEEWERNLLNLFGVGPWTKNIILMEALHLPDIIPHHDFGLRKAWKNLKNLPEIITPGELLEESKKFSPFRSILSWYLWESLSLDIGHFSPPKSDTKNSIFLEENPTKNSCIAVYKD